MRKVLYVLILAVLFFIPLKRVQIAELTPVTAIALQTEDGNVVLKTDSGFEGKGADVETAVENLKKNANAVVYLDTARYLLVTNDGMPYLAAMGAYLRETVGVCITDAVDNISESIKYLEVHGNLPELGQWTQTEEAVKNN